MKTPLTLVVVLFTVFTLNAQDALEKVDSFAMSFNKEYTDAADLAKQLTAPFKTDFEKARVIYAWVANNIRYDYKKFKEHKTTVHFRAKSKQEIDKKMQAAREKEIVTTLRSKKGVCEDYAQLVERMFESAGLESEVISGTDKTLRGHTGKHAWNAVKIDSAWRLLDATWGAGYVDEEDESFVRLYTPSYFNTPPQLFILNHLPKDKKWQLLDKPINLEDFNKQPIILYGNGLYPVEAFEPANGNIVLKGGKAEVRLKLSKIPEVLVVAVNGTREVESEVKKTDEGWVVISFSSIGGIKYSVYGGKTKHKAVLIGQFYVQ
jgi:transglutaminase/protease-like cytokinesis protein 3